MFVVTTGQRATLHSWSPKDLFEWISMQPWSWIFCAWQTFDNNKKVLLRERKRHTDRGVSSTTRDGVPLLPSGYPPARSLGVPPSQVPWVPPIRVPPAPLGYPHPLLGYPLLGYHPWGTPCWVPPHQGTPLAGPGLGAPLAGSGSGTPPPRCGLTKWNYYLPSRTTYAVGNNKCVIFSPQRWACCQCSESPAVWPFDPSLMTVTSPEVPTNCFRFPTSPTGRATIIRCRISLESFHTLIWWITTGPSLKSTQYSLQPPTYNVEQESLLPRCIVRWRR